MECPSLNLYSTQVVIPISGDDVSKLLVFLLVGVGLLGLGRWSSRLGVYPSGDSPADSPAPEVPTLDTKELVPEAESVPRVWPPSAEEVAASFPFDPSLGKIRIIKFFFEKADVVPGPSDPSFFADELHVQLYDPDSGHYWWQSYFVATPQGLAEILREKSWKYVYAPEILVLPRYDLEEIRRAVVSRMMADHEYFKDKPQPEEEPL
jgi:hypothetical protein